LIIIIKKNTTIKRTPSFTPNKIRLIQNLISDSQNLPEGNNNNPRGGAAGKDKRVGQQKKVMWFYPTYNHKHPVKKKYFC
jgi:hypothetical protein